MPLPKPKPSGETNEQWMGRCMGDATIKNDFKDPKQRVAVCLNLWREHHGPAANGPQPKRDVAGTCCTPGGGEPLADFIERCVEGGDSEEACLAAWHAGPSTDAPMMHSAPVEMKWMPTTLTVKGLNEGERMISGIATTPSVDHVGDIVESMGAKYATPVSIPLLWMHQHSQPVGTVTHVTKTDRGISFQARIAKVEEPGKLKDRVDEAWQTVRAGLVKGVSIGFTPVKDQYEMIKGGGIRFKEWNWHELSLVTVPAQSEATIQLIRSLDTQALRAATGQKQSARIEQNPAGVTANVKRQTSREAPMATKTIAEDIAAYASTRAAHAARMSELMSKASEDGSTLDDEQETEYDELKDKVASIDKHLGRLREQEKLNISLAVAVDGDRIGQNAGQSLGQRQTSSVVQIKRPPLEKGTAFVRYIAAQAMSKGNLQQAVQIAQRDAWKDTPEVASVLNYAAAEGTTVLKAAVAPANTYDTTWASPLVQLQFMASEFIDLVRAATILDKLSGGMRRVPFNIRVPLMSSGSTAYWVGEGSSKPMSSAAFDTITMTFAKVAALVAFTNESLRFSNPSLEAMIRQDMVMAIARKLDTDLLDSTKAVGTGSGGPSPASLTNGVSSIVATGTDAGAAHANIRTVLTTMAALDLDMTGGTWVMHVNQAIAFSLMLNTLGQREFPDINSGGGTLAGFRVVTSTNVPSSGGSPTDGYMIAFILPGEILLADDGNVTIDSSNQASLQFDSAPDSPVSASTVYRSLWQENMTAILAEREINWRKRRTGCVQWIDYARYV